jgi:putative glycosyltransferase (TIGR04372 family)
MNLKVVSDIYKNDKTLFFKKFLIKSLRIFFSLFYLPISIIFLLLMAVVRPFIVVRIGNLPSSRIHHFAVNTELFLLKDKNKNKKTIDIFYCENFISNKFLKKKWKEKIYIGNRFLFSQINFLVSIFLNKNIHLMELDTDRDTENFFCNSKPLLKLSDEEKSKGFEELKKIGLSKNDKFICLMNRDSSYLAKTFPGVDWSYHNYRDSKIDNYLLAAETLTKRGYFVFRMGSITKNKIETNNEKIIDYANSEFKSEFLDLFLMENCKFGITGNVGLDGLFRTFRKPSVICSMVPIGYLATYRNDWVHLFKKHFSLKKNRNLSLNEIFDLGLASSLRTEDFKKKNIELIENTPEEIRDAVIELDDRLNNKFEENEEQKNLQKKFWYLYEKNLEKHNIKYLHEKLFGVHSSNFLKSNNYFLE